MGSQDMDVDRKELIDSLGGETAVAKMSHEQRADALEDFQIDKLNAEVAARKKSGKFPTVAELEARVETRTWRLGSGKLFRPGDQMGRFEGNGDGPQVKLLPKLPKNPSFYDYFEMRIGPGTHLLQSAALARGRGESEVVVLACLLHDIGGSLMKTDHGYWGASLIEPYVSERVTFAVRYHQALRFFPDPEVGYEYPVGYYESFGIDYVPPPHIQAAHDYARNHKWYGLARSVTINDLYAFNPNISPDINDFRDIIDKHFKHPADGLGYDNSPCAHMWRSMANPDSPL
jgi:hypothetical protein